MNARLDRCAYCDLPAPPPTSPGSESYCCLGCRFAAAVAREGGVEGQIRWTLTRLGLAIFFTMNVMLFAMVLWSRDLFPPPPGTEQPLAAATENLFRYLCFLLATPVLLLLGIPLADDVIEQLKRRRVTTDLMLLVGVVVSYGMSAYATYRGQGHLYFEVACMVLVAVTLGRWLEAIGKQKTTRTLSKLKSLLPDQVSRIVDGREVPTRPEAIRIGDSVRVRAGERAAIDGVVRRGTAALDRQLLTGESEPVLVRPGDRVSAGSVDLDGELWIEATANGGEGTLAAFVERVESATADKDAYQRLADRIAAWFLPAIVALSALAFLWHARHRDLEAGVQAGLSVVLIACPCALGLATPLAVWSAIGTGARHQTLFRDGDTLSRLATVRVMAFDKTGTLTLGANLVAHCVAASDKDMAMLRHVLGPLVQSSDHPHARAIHGWLSAREEADKDPSENRSRVRYHSIRSVAGKGIEGKCDSSEQAVRVGQIQWLVETHHMSLSPRLADAANQASSAGLTVTAAAWEGAVRAVFALEESPRPRVGETLELLGSLGITPVILTGDDRQRAEATSRRWRVPIEAQLDPGQKADAIKRWRRESGPVAMVGDGLNDAPALAVADVGVALQAASDLARQTADVCILNDELSRLPFAVQLARQTVSAIRANLFWAFAYNAIGIGLAATGRLHPIACAAAMLASSLFVIGRSLKLGQVEPVELSGPLRESPR